MKCMRTLIKVIKVHNENGTHILDVGQNRNEAKYIFYKIYRLIMLYI